MPRSFTLTSTRSRRTCHTDKKIAERLDSFDDRWTALSKSHQERLKEISARASKSDDSDAPITVSYLSRKLREAVPDDTTWASEAVTSNVRFTDQIQPNLPKILVH